MTTRSSSSSSSLVVVLVVVFCTRLGRCRCSEHFLLLCRLKGLTSQKIFDIVSFSHFFIEIKMKKTLLIFVFFVENGCVEVFVFPLSIVKKNKRRKEVLFRRRTLKRARLSNTRRAVDKDATGTSDRDRNEGGDARG